MNKRLTNLNEGQKKPPHHVGEDRDGVYGKEKQGLLGTSGIATENLHLGALLHLCNFTQLVHSLLVFLVQNRLLLGR